MNIMKVETYFVNDKEFFERKSIRKEYKNTEVDDNKKMVDFRIIAIDSKNTIEFNHAVELKESRSIKRANNDGFVYVVTDSALAKLKKQYTYATDF